MPSPLELTVVGSFEEATAGWVSPASQIFPFLRTEWLTALERSGAAEPSTGWAPRHLVFHRAGAVFAVLPAYLKAHSMGEFVFDQSIAEFAETRLGVSYYPKLVVAVPFTPATGPRVLLADSGSEPALWEVIETLTTMLPSLLDSLGASSAHILFAPADEVTIFEQAGWAVRAGLQFQFKNRSFHGFEDFLSTFRAKRRAAIRRERREIAARDDLIFEVRSGAALRAVSPRLLHALYLTTVDKYAWGRRYLNERFFESVLRLMPEQLHVVLARRPRTSGDDGVVAGAFNLLGAEALYGRYWGCFEEEPFLHFETCLYRGIEETIERGLARFEPGAGGEHKEGRGFEATMTHSVHWFRDAALDRPVREFFVREKVAVCERLSQNPESTDDRSVVSSRNLATRG